MREAARNVVSPGTPPTPGTQARPNTNAHARTGPPSHRSQLFTLLDPAAPFFLERSPHPWILLAEYHWAPPRIRLELAPIGHGLRGNNERERRNVKREARF